MSMGMFRKFDHPDYLTAVDRVRQACKKHGKSMGTGCYSLEHAKQCRDLGDTLLLVAGDDGYLTSEARRCIQVLTNA
jgi:2-keto-3-deoxy-L-rhamnonate aldolase RhmA